MSPFETLYRDHFADIHRFLLKLTRNPSLAEELTQETFYQAIKSLRRFRGDCQIKTWLCQIAKNTYYKHQRRGLLERALPGRLTPVAPTGTEALAQEGETHRAVLRLIGGYDARTRSVLLYRLFADLPHAQIASLLGITENSSKVVYSRGRAKLREALRREGYHES